MTTLFAVLMAGGSGTRFWPASRASRPKQLLPLAGGEALLAQTSSRLGDLIPPERQLVMTNREYVDGVRALLPGIPPAQVVGEPEGRDTAACIGLASELARRVDPQATVVAMPSDHVIRPEEILRDHLKAAESMLAERPESILVFGIEPDRPATGYGYLRAGDLQSSPEGIPVHRLDAFVEKPEDASAKEMLEKGGHSWNAGIFAFRPAALRAAFDIHLPAMGPLFDVISGAFSSDGFEEVLEETFPKLEKISIDYGVMEKVTEALLMPLPVQWDDLGAWDALGRLIEADEVGNVQHGQAVALDSKNNLLSATEGVVAVYGVHDLIVVHTPDATLVCPRNDAERVKELVQALKDKGLDAYL